jgi:hypothetical protein
MRAETFMAAVSNGKEHDSFAVFVVYLFRGADRDIITETGEDAYRFLVFGHCCSYLLCDLYCGKYKYTISGATVVTKDQETGYICAICTKEGF